MAVEVALLSVTCPSDHTSSLVGILAASEEGW